MNKLIAGSIIMVAALLLCLCWTGAEAAPSAIQKSTDPELPEPRSTDRAQPRIVSNDTELMAQNAVPDTEQKQEKIEKFLTQSRVREDLARFAAMYRRWLDEAYDRAETDNKRDFIDTHRTRYSEEYMVSEYAKLLDSNFSIEQMDKLNTLFDDPVMREIIDAEHDSSLAHQERWSAYELEGKDFHDDRRKALKKLAQAKVAAEDALDMHRDIVIRSPASNPFSDSRKERLDHYLRYYAMSLEGYDNQKLGEIAQAMSDETYLAEKSLFRELMLGILQPNAHDLFGP